LHKLHNPLLRHWYELKLTKCLRVDVLFFYLITLFSKKRLFLFIFDKSVKNKPILVIFGMLNPEKI